MPARRISRFGFSAEELKRRANARGSHLTKRDRSNDPAITSRIKSEEIRRTTSTRAKSEDRPNISSSRLFNTITPGRVRYSEEQRNAQRTRLDTSGRNPQDAANARIAFENKIRGGGGNSLNYRGNASKRTLSYRNRGSYTGLGAAVNNRAEALRARYGNDPRIARAAGSILANAYT